MPDLCPHCRQPLPAEARRDPPLPPLEVPAELTIHDLTAEERERAIVERQGGVLKLRIGNGR